jgi:PhzF family phenazine biosynthesis protein
MRQWTIDAFAARPFEGNPACVVEPFDAWPDAGWMQSLAMENNQAETAFLRRTADPARFGLRWFTPAVEAPLCGHATLAAAHALFVELGAAAERLVFDTASGELTVRRTGEGYEMDFPAQPPAQIDPPPGLAEALGVVPREVWASSYLAVILDSEAQVRALAPDVRALATMPAGEVGNVGVVALADPGSTYDLVSRFFAPGSGIDEDPATGSWHCVIAPLFAPRLGKTTMACRQAYPGRGANIGCEVVGDRVLLRGGAVTVMAGTLRIAPPPIRV